MRQPATCCPQHDPAYKANQEDPLCLADDHADGFERRMRLAFKGYQTGLRGAQPAEGQCPCQAA